MTRWRWPRKTKKAIRKWVVGGPVSARERSRVLAWINFERVQNGMGPLRRRGGFYHLLDL